MHDNLQPTNLNRFSEADLRRLERETFVSRLELHESIDSTNNRALQLAQGQHEEYPLLVLAHSQTAGRGRGTNTWWSDSGALTFSVMLATDSTELPMSRWPQVSLTVGYAVCEALESLLAWGVPNESLHHLPTVQLKWPNDVYLEGKKICGILVEVPRDRQQRLLMGIGINVNNSIAQAPEEIQAIATALCDATGRKFALSEVLVEVLKHLSNHLDANQLWSPAILEGWRRRCFLTGRSIQLDLGTHHSAGICRGINDEGALLVEQNGKLEAHLAGVVTVVE